jgi:hypothetical protein
MTDALEQLAGVEFVKFLYLKLTVFFSLFHFEKSMV